MRSADADGGDDAVANGAELHATPTETMNVTVNELRVNCALFASGVKVSVLEAAAVTHRLLALRHVRG